MKSGITKYRRASQAAKSSSKSTRSGRERGVTTEASIGASGDVEIIVSEGHEDRVVFSEEVAERLANEALAEDQEMEIESLLGGAVGAVEPIETIETTTTTTTTRTTIRGGNATLGSREEIITEYAPLIKYIAQKIAARLPANIELDDLISSGVIGLMDAIEKYDPSRDNKFKTYAEFRIRGAILDELRAQDWVPRSVREKAKMLERAFSKIEHEKGRAATDEEICEELKITQDEYHDLLNQVRSVSLLSYDDLNNLSKGDRRSILGMSENGKSSTPFSEVNVAHLKQMISEAIKDLPEKQRLVLSLYYYEDLNLKEIGKVLDVTESRVSQLHTQAILRLKAKLKGNFDDFLLMFS